jgi:hypothetical protein
MIKQENLQEKENQKLKDNGKKMFKEEFSFFSPHCTIKNCHGIIVIILLMIVLLLYSNKTLRIKVFKVRTCSTSKGNFQQD